MADSQLTGFGNMQSVETEQSLVCKFGQKKPGGKLSSKIKILKINLMTLKKFYLKN